MPIEHKDSEFEQELKKLEESIEKLIIKFQNDTNEIMNQWLEIAQEMAKNNQPLNHTVLEPNSPLRQNLDKIFKNALHQFREGS